MKHITLIFSLTLISLTSVYRESQKELDFLNKQNRTSSLLLTDGEATMLPYFSGENATDFYTVYFLGKTEKECEYWDVYNKNGFWKGKDSELIHLYTKEMERYINRKKELYYIFAISIKKSMIKETAEDEFQPNSNAVYKTYLLTDGKWIVIDSFNIKDAPKETAEYLKNVIKKRRDTTVKTSKDSIGSWH